MEIYYSRDTHLFTASFIFDYGALFVCVNDRTYVRVRKPGNCFNNCGSSFGVPFYLLDRK